MKTNKCSRVLAISIVGLSMMTAGCASVAVSDKAIEKNTAFALGVDEGAFTISNRENSGVKTTYLVTRNSGQKYNCYVTGAVGVTGRVVSDAICQQIGKTDSSSRAAKDNSSNPANSSCNALLKAAGKCS